MKLHDLKPAPGSKKDRMRVGRGIAAGKGKTAGRGTKGQKARAGGSIPPFFEGGQTPLHIRIPKLHGFKNRNRIEYQVVNVGRIAAYAEAGRFQEAAGVDPGPGPLTVNAELLRATGLISSMRIPVKVLGQGDVNTALFVVADAFTSSAREKLEGAGGTAQELVVPERAMAALGFTEDAAAEAPARPARRPRASELRAQAAADEKARAERADKARAEKPAKGQKAARPEKADRPAKGEATGAPDATATAPTSAADAAAPTETIAPPTDAIAPATLSTDSTAAPNRATTGVVGAATVPDATGTLDATVAAPAVDVPGTATSTDDAPAARSETEPPADPSAD